MGVENMTIDAGSIEAALFRSTGVMCEGMQYGPANDPAKRNYTAKGSGRGHVYLHSADSDPLSKTVGPKIKSRFENHTTMVAAIVDVLSSSQGRAALAWLDANPTVSDGLWLRGKTALRVSGSWYGYEQNSNTMKKVETVSINMRSHGDALFITSVYPETFQTMATTPP